MNIFLSILFLIGLCCMTYFVGRLITWVVWKIAPENCKREFTNKDILTANLVMLVGIICFTIIFYNLIC